jgi:hypothetical protein
MRSIAERSIACMPAPAKGDRCAPAQSELFAVLIHHCEIAFDAQWTIIENCDFCASQGFLRLNIS